VKALKKEVCCRGGFGIDARARVNFLSRDKDGERIELFPEKGKFARGKEKHRPPSGELKKGEKKKGKSWLKGRKKKAPLISGGSRISACLKNKKEVRATSKGRS